MDDGSISRKRMRSEEAPHGYRQSDGLPRKTPLKRRKRSSRRRATRRRRYGGGGGGRGRAGNISVIQGYGDYSWNKSKSYGANIGGYLGHMGGEWLGGKAQSLMGLGDYTVNSNVFMSGNLPEVVNQPGGGGTIIRFQEYLGDVITSPTANTFQINSFTLNAADSLTFPWASQIAANYEQYAFEGVVFEFKSTSADALNSVNTALGSVMLATQYDFVDQVFNSKLQMLNYEFSSACKPSANVLHMIECAPNVTTVDKLYTINTPVPTGADPRLYHLGKFSIATTGFQGTSVNIGQLHVTYQMRLMKPKLWAGLGNTIGDFFYQKSGGAGQFTNALPLGDDAVVGTISNNLIDTIGVTRSGTTLSLLANTGIEYYRVEIVWVGVAANFIAPTLTLTNCTTAGNRSAPSAAVLSASCIQTFGIRTLGNSLVPSVAFSVATLPTAGTEIIIRILQTNPITLAV